MFCKWCRFSSWNGKRLMCEKSHEVMTREMWWCNDYERVPGADDDKPNPRPEGDSVREIPYRGRSKSGTK